MGKQKGWALLPHCEMIWVPSEQDQEHDLYTHPWPLALCTLHPHVPKEESKSNGLLIPKREGRNSNKLVCLLPARVLNLLSGFFSFMKGHTCKSSLKVHFTFRWPKFKGIVDRKRDNFVLKYFGWIAQPSSVESAWFKTVRWTKDGHVTKELQRRCSVVPDLYTSKRGRFFFIPKAYFIFLSHVRTCKKKIVHLLKSPFWSLKTTKYFASFKTKGSHSASFMAKRPGAVWRNLSKFTNKQSDLPQN